MNFKKLESLAVVVSGPVGGIKYEPLPDGDTLMVHWRQLIRYEEGERKEGSWSTALYPCYSNGAKCFLSDSDWQPAEGYSANTGKIQEILPYDEGMKILGEKGAFDWMFPEIEAGEENDGAAETKEVEAIFDLYFSQQMLDCMRKGNPGYEGNTVTDINGENVIYTNAVPEGSETACMWPDVKFVGKAEMLLCQF